MLLCFSLSDTRCICGDQVPAFGVHPSKRGFGSRDLEGVQGDVLREERGPLAIRDSARDDGLRIGYGKCGEETNAAKGVQSGLSHACLHEHGPPSRWGIVVFLGSRRRRIG
jgi:hypothetical protein